MSGMCPECGASVPEGGTCRDNLHALLILESQMPGLNSPVSHFRAVACYNLQHPDSMRLTAEGLVALHRSLSEELDGRVSLGKLRGCTRKVYNGPVRVMRREGEAEVEWPRGSWPMTVEDLLSVEPEPDAYIARVRQWAQSVRETLDRERSAGDKLPSRSD